MSGLLVMRNEVSQLGTYHYPSRDLPNGVLQTLQLLTPSEARDELGLPPHNLTFTTTVTIETRPRPPTELVDALVEVLQRLSLSSSAEGTVYDGWFIDAGCFTTSVCVRVRRQETRRWC